MNLRGGEMPPLKPLKKPCIYIYQEPMKKNTLMFFHGLLIYIYNLYICYVYYVYVISRHECCITFIITEPEGRRPKGEVIINVIQHE